MSVVMYVKPGCPYCAAAREDLDARGEPFEERDATADPCTERPVGSLER